MDPKPADLLIIEDQAPMRRALREHLQAAYPGATIFEAADGARALELCRRHAFRVVLTDIGLPDINGIDLIPRITAILAGTVIIVVSMHADPIYAERAQAAGAIAYVTKDRVYRDLLPAVARVLGAAQGRESA